MPLKLTRLALFREGAIATAAAWGTAGALKVTPELMGFQAIRVRVLIEAEGSAVRSARRSWGRPILIRRTSTSWAIRFRSRWT